MVNLFEMRLGYLNKLLIMLRWNQRPSGSCLMQTYPPGGLTPPTYIHTPSLFGKNYPSLTLWCLEHTHCYRTAIHEQLLVWKTSGGEASWLWIVKCPSHTNSEQHVRKTFQTGSPCDSNDCLALLIHRMHPSLLSLWVLPEMSYT